MDYKDGKDDNDEDYGDESNDTKEGKPGIGKKTQFLRAFAENSALISKGQIVKPPENEDIWDSKNPVILGKQGNIIPLQGKKSNDKGTSVSVSQQQDEDFDFTAIKNYFQENIVSVEKELQSKVPECGMTKRQKRKNSKLRRIKKNSPIAKLEDLLKKDLKRKEEQKSRCLYVRRFPSGSTPEVFKALSSDIVNVLTPWTRGNGAKYRLLEFESEQKAIKNHKFLQGKTINGKKLVINLYGKKYLSGDVHQEAENVKVRNACCLVVKRFRRCATTNDFKALSPDILNVSFQFKFHKIPILCYLTFQSERKAIENFIMLRDKKLKGKEIDVNFYGEKELSEELIQEIDKMIPKNSKKKLQKEKVVQNVLLSVRGFSAGTTAEDFKVLSSDIQRVIKLKNREYALFRFLKFENEQKAIENYNLLQGKTINGKKLRIDFYKPKEEIESVFLAMYGFSKGTTPDDIKALSCDILDVVMPKFIPSKAGPCFMEFENELIAIKNYKLLQGKAIEGKELYVTFVGTKMLSEGLLEIENEKRKMRYSRCIAVKGFPFGTTADDFKTLSSDIVEVFIRYRENKLCGLLEFENEQKSNENYLLLRGKIFKGRELNLNGEKRLSEKPIKEICSKMIPQNLTKEEMEKKNVLKKGYRLYVKGIPLGASREDLKALSSEILNVSYLKKISGGMMSCFFKFENEQKVNENYKLLQGKVINGKEIHVDYIRAKKERDSYSLCVYGLPTGITPGDIKALSSDIVDVMPRPNYRGVRHYCVEFENEQKAIENYKLLQGKTVAGKELYVAFLRGKMLPEELLEIGHERRKERYARCLAVKGFPFGTIPEDFKTLSSDVVDVFIRKKWKNMCGLLEFENEQKANENYVLLQGKKVNGEVLHVNLLVGVGKETPVAVANSDLQQEPLINHLLCEGIPIDATIGEIAHLFPKALSITIQKQYPEKEAGVTFYSGVDAAEAFKDSENAVIRGKSVRIQFPKKRKRSEQEQNLGSPPAMKFKK